ncbi:MAG: hypothetical protein AB7N61_25525 [Acidimicrobiia bacterium]
MHTIVDAEGQIVIPLLLLEAIGLADGGSVDVTESCGRLIIEPIRTEKHLTNRQGVVVCEADDEMPTLTADDIRAVLERARR